MKISLDGYQLVEAAQAYIKKEYGIDLSTVECFETWMLIHHNHVEYKRNEKGIPKRDSEGHLIVDEEKSEKIELSTVISFTEETCVPTQGSATLELYYERNKKEDS